MKLRSIELIVPRVSLFLIALGGFLILLKDIIEDPAFKEEPVGENVLPYIAGTILVMWLFGWSFRNLGLFTSTFIFLSCWWAWLTYRDAKRFAISTINIKLLKLFSFAIIIAATVYLLFIVLLGMYLPRTVLF